MAFGIIDRTSVLFNPGDWVREKGTERIGEVVSVGAKVNQPGFVKVFFLDGWNSSVSEDSLTEIDMDEDSLAIALEIREPFEAGRAKSSYRRAR